MSSHESDTYYHVPVLSDAVIQYLKCAPGKIFVDCTLGGAGHATQISRAIGPSGQLVAIDQDISAINNARHLLDQQMMIIHDNFKNIRTILASLNIDVVDGIIADLGMSLFHIRQSGRGFSFMADEPLDMRMNTQNSKTAKDLLANLTEKKLSQLLWEYGEERYSRQIASKIVRARKNYPIETTTELCEIIKNAIPIKMQNRQKIHPATRTFMALRMAVNDELECIQSFLNDALLCLKPGGRLCIISFHSLEDRMVKQHMRRWENPCCCPKDLPKCICGKKSMGKCIVRKGIVANDVEVSQNPMARSARMRVFEKISLNLI